MAPRKISIVLAVAFLVTGCSATRSGYYDDSAMARAHEYHDQNLAAMQRAARAAEAGDADAYIREMRRANQYRQRRDQIMDSLSGY